ncbi:MAG TPA: hypothetical protein VFK10_05545 [Burkholderiaceae bacterium]|nr:hypothetical protein [Burkholderiaceae bacterium]
MSRHSRTPVVVSPLLWLAPLPFVLAMCLPMDLTGSAEPPAERVAAAAAPAPAASIPQAPSR